MNTDRRLMAVNFHLSEEDIENIHDIKEMREVRVSSKNLVVDDKQQLNVGKENEC